MGFRQRAAEDGEILRKDIDHAAIDRAPAGHDAVAIGAIVLHPEIGAAMGDEHVEFLEAALIHQQFDPLAGGQLAALVLRIDAPLPAAQSRLAAAAFQFLQDVLHRAAPSGSVAER